MSRIRSIHPGIYTDEAWASVSITARWLGMGLCTEADDNGIFEWKPLQLKMRLFPADDVNVGALLAELAEAGILLGFDAEGKRLGAVRNFCKFQRPRKPKAWFPVTAAARAFVALGSEPVVDPDDEQAAVPKKSELPAAEPVEVPQLSGMSPQMEDGGGKVVSEAKASSSAKTDKRPENVVWDDVFAAAWKAYPHFPGRSASRAKCWLAWREQVRLCGCAERLFEAVKRYARLDKGHKGDAGAKAFERWLRDGRWEHWLDGEANPNPIAVFPDGPIRYAVELAKDEAWTASWLDPCAWDAEHRAIIPRTNFAAAKLKQEVGDVLRGLGVHVEERAAA